MDIDKKDRLILEALQADARQSLAALGKRIGLSQPAMSERVRKLEDAGVIEGYGARVNLRALRLTGLALAACEKTVQIVYERNLRPAEKLHQPWVDRVLGQLLAAYDELEREVAVAPWTAEEAALTQDAVSAAVAWSFTQLMLPELVAPARCPALAAHAARAEALPVFAALPQL